MKKLGIAIALLIGISQFYFHINEISQPSEIILIADDKALDPGPMDFNHEELF